MSSGKLQNLLTEFRQAIGEAEPSVCTDRTVGQDCAPGTRAEHSCAWRYRPMIPESTDSNICLQRARVQVRSLRR